MEDKDTPPAAATGGSDTSSSSSHQLIINPEEVTVVACDDTPEETAKVMTLSSTTTAIGSDPEQEEPPPPLADPPLQSNDDRTIAAVDDSVVRKICSAQVVVTLSLAVKELVENSLDSGATSIDIRTTDYGTSTVTVADNGSGILPSNLHLIGLGHCTSKLSSFAELSSVSTFGFRGEALSALCALAPPLTITTCTVPGSPAHIATYAPDGSLSSLVQSHSAPQATSGTTVTLHSLFSPLPVRRREFLLNARRREFHRVISIVSSYALINHNVRFSVRNDNKSVLNLEPAKDMRTRITQIFGRNLNVVPFEQEECVCSDLLHEFLLTDKNFVNDTFDVNGFVAVPGSGSGKNRCSSVAGGDNYVYVNKRPVDAPKVSRVVVDAYRGHVMGGKSSSSSLQPFFALNVTTRRDNVDVNVSKDKRTNYIKDELSLLVIIKASLLTMLGAASATLNISEAGQQTLRLYQNTRQQQQQQQLEGRSNTRGGSGSSDDDDEGPPPTKKQQQQYSPVVAPVKKSATLLSSVRTGGASGRTAFLQSFARHNQQQQRHHPTTTTSGGGNSSRGKKLTSMRQQQRQLTATATSSRRRIQESSSDDDDDVTLITSQQDDVTELATAHSADDVTPPPPRVMYDDDPELLSPTTPTGGPRMMSRKEVLLRVDWSRLLRRPTRLPQDLTQPPPPRQLNIPPPSSTASSMGGVGDLSSTQLHLPQSSLSSLRVVGQFNLGFIVLSSPTTTGHHHHLGGSLCDLFIVDQHAADEKYNFEHLTRTTVFQTQRLIHPQQLQLSHTAEDTLLNNLAAFKANGFHFQVDTDAAPTCRVSLTHVPFSKNVVFGKHDVDELVFMMEDHDGVEENSRLRPSRVRDLLASRACRKSVMVGTPLSASDMTRITSNLATLNQPWNCPHGRPTIRHLARLPPSPPLLEITNPHHN